jgi:hypothetical protein
MSVSDVFYSRYIPRDLNILKAETKAEHRGLRLPNGEYLDFKIASWRSCPLTNGWRANQMRAWIGFISIPRIPTMEPSKS